MSDVEQLDRELKEYLEIEPNLRRDERITYLRTIFKKHLDLNKLEHIINARDFFDIISGAKYNFSNNRLPAFISRKRLDGNEITHIAMIESFISYLNRMDLLKKLIKFDYTEEK